MKFGLDAPIIDSLHNVFARYPTVEQVKLFGSRASGTFRDGSDIDLAIIAPTMSDEEFTLLWDEVDELPIVFSIDLLHFDRLGNQALKASVLAEGVPFVKMVD